MIKDQQSQALDKDPTYGAAIKSFTEIHPQTLIFTDMFHPKHNVVSVPY